MSNHVQTTYLINAKYFAIFYICSKIKFTIKARGACSAICTISKKLKRIFSKIVLSCSFLRSTFQGFTPAPLFLDPSLDGVK